MRPFRQLAAGMLPLNKAYLRTARKYVSSQLAADILNDAFLAEWTCNRSYADLEHVQKAFHLAVKNAALHHVQYTRAKKRQYVDSALDNASPVSYSGIAEVEAASLYAYFMRKLKHKPALQALLTKLVEGREGTSLTPAERVNRGRLKEELLYAV